MRAEPEPRYYEIRRQVTARLMERDVGAWARELAATPLTDEDPVGDLLLRCIVFRRAGHATRMEAAVRRLAALDPKPDPLRIDGLIDLLRKLEAWAAVRVLLDASSEVPSGYVVEQYIKAWEESEGASAENRREVEAWLFEKSLQSESWFAQRLAYHARHGTGGALIEEVGDEARRGNPDRAAQERVLRLIAKQCRYFSKPGRGLDADWVIGLATDFGPGAAYRLSWEFRGTELEARLLELAIELPFTDVDEALTGWRMSVGPRPGPDGKRSWEHHVHDWARYRLSKTFLKLGETQRAQALMVELADRHEGGIPPGVNASFAGQTQAVTGIFTVENRIAEAAEDEEGSPSYWWSRAEYYRGRGNTNESMAACLRILELLPSAVADDELERVRRDAFMSFVFVLVQEGRTADARELVFGELARLETESVSFDRIVEATFPKLDVDPLDDLVWCYLATWWQGSHVRLSGLARRAGHRAGEFWDRAEALADGDPERSLDVGRELMNVRPDSAERLFAEAIEHVSRAEPAASLFELYCRRGAVHEAEAMLALLPHDWHSSDGVEGVTPYGQLAMLSAQSGEHAEALRLWRISANVNRHWLAGVPELVGAGMTDELLDFYRTMAVDDPECVVPARAIAMILE